MTQETILITLFYIVNVDVVPEFQQFFQCHLSTLIAVVPVFMPS